jgi:hypothetical protein
MTEKPACVQPGFEAGGPNPRVANFRYSFSRPGTDHQADVPTLGPALGGLDFRETHPAQIQSQQLEFRRQRSLLPYRRHPETGVGSELRKRTPKDGSLSPLPPNLEYFFAAPTFLAC